MAHFGPPRSAALRLPRRPPPPGGPGPPDPGPAVTAIPTQTLARSGLSTGRCRPGLQSNRLRCSISRPCCSHHAPPPWAARQGGAAAARTRTVRQRHTRRNQAAGIMQQAACSRLQAAGCRLQAAVLVASYSTRFPAPASLRFVAPPPTLANLIYDRSVPARARAHGGVRRTQQPATRGGIVVSESEWDAHVFACHSSFTFVAS
jgi:hypothetical protein